MSRTIALNLATPKVGALSVSARAHCLAIALDLAWTRYPLLA
jgi:hypothetical protein